MEKKTKPNTTKAHIHKSKDMYYNTENKHKKHVEFDSGQGKRSRSIFKGKDK